MRDFPKWLNTKQDYLNCLQDFPEQIKHKLRELLTDRFIWVQTGVLTDEDQGVTDDTHRVVKSENERFQYEYLEDSKCRQEGAIGKLFEKLEEIQKEVSETNKQAALTNQLLLGVQDVPGLVARVAKLETDVGKFNTIKAQFAAVGAFIGCAVTALISFFK